MATKSTKIHEKRRGEDFNFCDFLCFSLPCFFGCGFAALWNSVLLSGHFVFFVHVFRPNSFPGLLLACLVFLRFLFSCLSPSPFSWVHEFWLIWLRLCRAVNLSVVLGRRKSGREKWGAMVFRDVENPDQRAANSSRPIPSVAPAVSASPVDTSVGPLFGNLE